MAGISASTGSSSTRTTSSSILKLESRYSGMPTSSRPRSSPTNGAPTSSPTCCLRFDGRSGNDAGSRILNCSPICLRSRLAASFESSRFSSRLA